MSRGARALTLYGGIWADIVEARPDLEFIDWNEVWGFDPKHNWSRVDPGMLNIVSLMKMSGWRPGAGEIIANAKAPSGGDSESYWKAVIERITMDGLQKFAAWAIDNVPFATMKSEQLNADELAFLASMPIKQHAPAQWGTW